MTGGDLLTPLAALIAAIPAYLALRTGKKNAHAIQEVHVSINSRLSQLLETTRLAAHAEGKLEAINSPTEGNSWPDVSPPSPSP